MHLCLDFLLFLDLGSISHRILRDIGWISNRSDGLLCHHLFSLHEERVSSTTHRFTDQPTSARQISCITEKWPLLWSSFTIVTSSRTTSYKTCRSDVVFEDKLLVSRRLEDKKSVLVSVSVLRQKVSRNFQDFASMITDQFILHSSTVNMFVWNVCAYRMITFGYLVT